ncbi:MAG: hypothetical protein K2W95_13445 [Candidatus Obscuribacterales bacterium]|nr:hypothetical protein [Candidatus Obscuribacterales bacterium]
MRLPLWLLGCSCLTMLSPLAHAAPSMKTASEFQSKAAVSSVSPKQNVTYQIWEDLSRGRSIPVKIYMPSTSAKSPAPVLVFSHGLGGTREAAGYLGEYLSARGYVCIHIQHPGSDSGVWQPVATGGREAILAEMKTAANAANLKFRVGDVTFVLDELEKRNASDPLLGSKLNLSAIGLAGHSFGAGTTLALSGQNYPVGPRTFNFRDSRIKAAVYLSPPVNLRNRQAEEIFGSIEIPGLLMTGTDDVSPIGETTARQRVIPFHGIKAPGQYLVNFQGGDHMIFSGHTTPLRVNSDEKFQHMINKVTGAFLDAYLKGDASQRAWLKNDCGAYLGKAADFQSK